MSTLTVANASALRHLLALAAVGIYPHGRPLQLVIPEGSHLQLGGTPLVTTASVEVIIESVGGGSTLDAESRSRAIEVSNGSQLTLRHIHIARGVSPGGESGGCIFVSSAPIVTHANVTRLTLDGCRVERCAAYKGGAIAVLGGALEANNVSLESCTAERGGCLAVEGGQATVENSTLTDCAVLGDEALGGGVYTRGSIANITSTTIANATAIATANDGLALGGGILTLSSKVDVVSTTIADCAVLGSNSEGGGVFVDEGSDVRFMSATIANTTATATANHGEANGGGIFRSAAK